MSEEKIVTLKQEIVRWEAKNTELEQQSRQAGERVAELEDQRGQQVLGALAENDPAAKAQLEKLTLELERVVRHSADLVLAHEQAGARVTGLRQELVAAERTVDEEQLVELLQERETLGHEVARMVEDQLLPLLRTAGGLSEEMSGLARRLGLSCPVRALAFTDLLAFPAWAVEKVFPIQYSPIRHEPLEARGFRPSDFGLDPSEALASHDRKFRARLLEEMHGTRPVAAASVAAADD